jgi:predicted O-methyltransferase YrrM
MELEYHLKTMRRRQSLSPLLRITGANISKENYYRNLMYDGARGERINLPPLYPVQSAANYSLLYLLLRTCCELPISRVLELGVGQSTLLLNAVSTAKGTHIHSVEAEHAWAERVGRKVAHAIDVHELEARESYGRRCLAYSITPALPKDIDLLVVDGPRGTPRYSRWGALEIADGCLAQEFIVVFDDAERIGEQDTIREFLKSVRPNARVHHLGSSKCQLVAFTPKFGAVGYF